MFAFTGHGSGFDSAWAVGNDVVGDSLQQGLLKYWEFPWWRGREVRAERQDRPNGTGEADSHRVDVMRLGGLQD